MMFNMNVSDIFEDAASNGGGTYKRAAFSGFWGKPEFISGYMVSVYGMEFKVNAKEFELFQLDTFVNNRREEFYGGYLGIWEDGDSVYLDVSLHIEDEEIAEKFAIDNAQLAYWDCKAGIAISVD